MAKVLFFHVLVTSAIVVSLARSSSTPLPSPPQASIGSTVVHKPNFSQFSPTFPSPSLPVSTISFYKLALFWGPGYCNSMNCKWQNVSPRFTIHGLWPYIDANTGLCKDKEQTPQQPTYERVKDQKFLDILVSVWPDYETPEDAQIKQQNIWKHEWNKHGRCTRYSQEQFMHQVIDLFKSLPSLLDILGKNHVNPSPNLITPLIFKSALYLGLYREVQLNCRMDRRKDKATDKNFLREVLICFDEKFKMMSCPKPTDPKFEDFCQSGFIFNSDPVTLR